ncbi:hypothetical protein CVT24_002574 [Panaeolus cyanescens]|uniref:Uncharacterized protein n=1 Tax=Panaeolus cyanescens TaxID=181874 RepID=A0A409YTZ3_9AGAR|nr:hypothetical protein CVT24_002574 [Panaeolus cyanescens]
MLIDTCFSYLEEFCERVAAMRRRSFPGKKTVLEEIVQRFKQVRLIEVCRQRRVAASLAVGSGGGGGGGGNDDFGDGAEEDEDEDKNDEDWDLDIRLQRLWDAEDEQMQP